MNAITKKIAIAVAALFMFAGQAAAQTDTTPALKWSSLHGLEYEVNAGINFGGTSPLPLPAEIRKIESYQPNLNLSIGATATKWLSVDRKWGLMVGIRLETKSMSTQARVKSYSMEIIDGGGRLSGYWTGKVNTDYHTTLLTVPITGVWRAHNRLKVNFGVFLSYNMRSEFDGFVSDGYLRQGNPTGEKVVFEGDKEAAYDFSDDLRHFQWGLQSGVTWKAFKHLTVHGNLTWGLNDVFKSSFKTITFNMYPIFLNAGFGYAF